MYENLVSNRTVPTSTPSSLLRYPVVAAAPVIELEVGALVGLLY
jgi:hypothetical protein